MLFQNIDIDIASQLLVLGLELPDALWLGGQSFADAGLPQLRCINLHQPAPDGLLAQLQVPANFANAQALHPDHLHDLQLEGKR